MKKVICCILSFLLGFGIFLSNNFASSTAYALDKNAKCDFYKQKIEYQNQINDQSITFIGKNTYVLNLENQPYSVKGSLLNRGLESRFRLMQYVASLGYSESDAVLYAFPELNSMLSEIELSELVNYKNAELKAIENTGKVKIENSKNGLQLDKNALFCDIFYNSNFKNAKNGENNITVNLKLKDLEPDTKKEDLEKCLNLRGSFKTDFSSSSNERKNNIRLALKKIDGVVIDPGEEFSFNKATGQRGEESGYQKAKIIKGGSFVYDVGGGVCQVSSTLYNSALLSNLDITEVHPHSLPVSYVEPCFDAMVNSGSSDLKFKNNTGEKIIIATSYNNDTCLVNIYGVKNEFKIVRKSEKVDTIENYETEITSNYEAYGLNAPPLKGEQIVLSQGKAGYKALGELEYYKEGVLIKTKKIRENVYKPTKRVVIISE